MASIVSCTFCGNRALRAKEHVFPSWLLTALDARDEVIPFRHFSVEGKIVSERRHTLDGFRFGHVCAQCNNGHLSRLETEARRILAGIWRGRRTLAPVDAYGLALWVLKTAVMLNAASNYRRIVADGHARAVRMMSPPAGLFVHLAFREKRLKVSWHQSQQLRFRGQETAVRAAHSAFGTAGFNVALGFADLLLRVVYLPVAGFAVRPAIPRRKGQFLVWPRRSPLRMNTQHRYSTIGDFVADAMAYQVYGAA